MLREHEEKTKTMGSSGGGSYGAVSVPNILVIIRPFSSLTA